MAVKKGKRRFSIDEVHKIHILREEGYNRSQVASMTGFNYRTIMKYWKDENPISTKASSQFMQEYKKAKQETINGVLALVQSDDYAMITRKAMNLLLKDDNLEYDLAKSGIRNMIAWIGNSVDKTLAIKDMVLKERAMAIREKELELKEKELELRISNPEAFHTVQIINDAPFRRDEMYASQGQ